jgi:Mn-containing catalase
MIKVPDTYRIDEPYPEIKNAKYDPQTVAILQNLYSSIKSEMTATCNYSYQHFITVRFNENIAEAFLQIGIVEMNHMDLLAEAIIDFGGNPLFADNKGTFFTGQWVNYSTILYQYLKLIFVMN